MVYLKSLSTNLISIYVSVFLIFSPLQAQSKERAKLFLKTGVIVEGEIIKIKDDRIISQKERDLLAVQQNTYIFRKVSWKISTSNGETYEVLEVKPAFNDTLYVKFIDSEDFFYTKPLALGIINEIRVEKNTRIIGGILRGGAAGFVISEGLATLVYFSNPDEMYIGFAFVFFPILLVPPSMVIGGIYGAFKGRDEVYILSGKSDVEKKATIEELLYD